MKMRPRVDEGVVSEKPGRLIDEETYNRLRAAGVQDPNRRAFLAASARLAGAFVAGSVLGPFARYISSMQERGVYRPKLEFPFPVELPHPEWPIYTQQWVNLLGGRVRREQLVRVLDPDGVWRGRVFFEGFRLRHGVTLGERDVHVDSYGRPIIDPNLIYAFDEGPILAEEIVLTGELPASIMFRRGGLTPDARQFPPHYHLYTGFRPGVSFYHVEQMDIYPVPDGSVCPPGNIGVFTNSEAGAWYRALLDARDSVAFTDGFIRRLTIEWRGGGETRRISTEMLRLLSERYRNDTGRPFPIQTVPVGAFLSPGQVAAAVGGVPEAWVLNPGTWDWHLEAWKLKDRVRFTDDGGHVDTRGRLITWNDGEEAIWQVHGESPNMPDQLVAPNGMSLWALVLMDKLPNLSFSGYNGAVVNKSIAERLAGRPAKGIHQAAVGHERIALCEDPSTYALDLWNRGWLNARGNRDSDVIPYFWTGREWGPPHGVFVPRVEN